MVARTITLAEAKEHARRVADEMEALVLRLLGLECCLPESPAAESDEMDAITEVRSVFLCVVTDNMRPAISDLRRLAAPAAPSGERKR